MPTKIQITAVVFSVITALNWTATIFSEQVIFSCTSATAACVYLADTEDDDETTEPSDDVDVGTIATLPTVGIANRT